MPFPCDMTYNYDLPANDTTQRFHGRLCGENELCIGPQKCLPIDPITGLYNKSYDVLVRGLKSGSSNLFN